MTASSTQDRGSSAATTNGATTTGDMNGTAAANGGASSTGRLVVAFDLFDTLLSTASVDQHLAKICGDEVKARQVAEAWRKYQLEYTCRITAMGLYRHFSEINEGALLHAAAEAKLTLRPENVVELMKDYHSLRMFPEVPCALDALSCLQGAEEGGIDCYIFSNGCAALIHASVANSPDLSRYTSLFQGEVSVEEQRAFKPDRRVYDDLVRRVGKEGREEDVWIVTSEPAGVVGARARGLEVAWIDRQGTGWMDKLGGIIGGIKPTVVASGVDRAVIEIMNHAGGH